jgi:signal transduction histidine kinase/ActR/RegA family two-component response regulator
MSEHNKNQTYRDLQSLFRLFIASIFIIGSLNYIFSGLIDDLGEETKNLQIKKNIEERIHESIISARDDFSQIILSNSNDNFNYFKNHIEKKLQLIHDYTTVLRLGGTLKDDNNIYQNISYQPKLYSTQYDNYNKLSLERLQKDLISLQTSLTLFYTDLQKNNFDNFTKTNRIKVQNITKKFENIKNNNDNLLRQTIYQINKINSEILIKKDKYLGYELLAIIFVIGSLLYTSNLISNQILKNSEILEVSNKTAKQMAQKSKQASKAKSEFLANMSYEIRTPLNAILGFIDILKEREKDSEKLKYIETIQSSSTTLLGIINDILDFSKIESGNLTIEKVDFNTFEELSTITDLFRAKASEKSVSLTFKIDKNIPKALVSDPLRIKQVIANLLSNAIKFTPRNGRIELLMKYTDNKLHISVKDNGIGIPEDKQADIFKAFSQAESSTTRKYGGTGLGLAISSKLVTMLGGELKLESSEGNGSRFYFEIPVKVGKYKKSTSIKDSNIKQLKNKRILLVEDNKANQMFMSLILKKFGLIFDIANDGVEAVNMYKDNYYDLILMDENMPNLNGIEATKEILEYEKNKKRRHTPIIALTANALKGDRERFLNAGMDEYLTKPLDKEKLATLLNNFLTNKTEEIV